MERLSILCIKRTRNHGDTKISSSCAVRLFWIMICGAYICLSMNCIMFLNKYVRDGSDNMSILRHDKKIIFQYENVTRSNRCSLTVVIFDPRVPLMKKDNKLWVSIESVIANGPSDMCVSIQTSVCELGFEGSKEEILWNVADNIIRHAPLPLFRQFLVGGRVRVSIVDHTKYQLTSCSNFWNPGHAWTNIQYWEDEFHEFDNDLTLFIQDDTLLCRPLLPGKWRGLAYVGAPWPHQGPQRSPSLCHYFQLKWSQWNRNKISSRQMESFCVDGPFGNGGLSLRSRYWMKKAILTCPHSRYSGLNQSYIKSSPCVVYDYDYPILYKLNLSKRRVLRYNTPEDLYFAIILRAIQAPLPTAFEASLFSSEILFPHEVIFQYGPNNVSLLRNYIMKRMIPHDLTRFDSFLRSNHFYNHSNISFPIDRQQLHFTSIGFHNTWNYHSQEPFRNLLLQNKEICPYFSFLFPQQHESQSLL